MTDPHENLPAVMAEQIATFPSEIVEAIMAVRKRVPYLRKDARNPHFKYSYVSEGQVLGAVREAMDENGLVLVPNVVGSHVNEAKGIATVDMQFRLVHKSGAAWPELIRWQGMGQDTQDKAIAKAATSGLKYFLLKFFQIETGDDPDKDRPESATEAQAAPPPSAPKEEPKPAGTGGKGRPSRDAQRIKKAIQDRSTESALIALWKAEKDNIKRLKEWEQDRLLQIFRDHKAEIIKTASDDAKEPDA